MPKAKAKIENKTSETPSTEATLTTSTVAGMKAYAKWALSRQDNRLYLPFDLALLLALVVPDDKVKLESRIKTGKQGTIEIQLSKQPSEAVKAFLRSWIRANGKNRDRRKEHYRTLAESFRQTFVIEGTNYVVDSNGMVVDAGHSGLALCLAFYPKEWLNGIEPHKPYLAETKGEDGKTIKTQVASDSVDGKALLATGNYLDVNGVIYNTKTWKDYVSDDWQFAEEGQFAKVDIVLRVTINTQPNRALKLAETRLPATLLDYIRSVGPLRELIDSSELPATISTKISEILRLWYMRVNHVMKDGNVITFGYTGKGGKLTLEDGPSWLLVAIGHLIECTNLLKNSQGSLSPWGCFTSVKQVSKGGISIPLGLAAMMVSDESGRKRIAKLLTSLASELTTEGKTIQDATVVRLGEPSLSNDVVLQALINYGKGLTNCIELAKARHPSPMDDKATIPQWQIPEGRVDDTWDSDDTVSLQDGELSFVQFLVEQQAVCNALLGKEGKKQAAAAVSRKLGKTK